VTLAREARFALRLSQREFARLLGVSVRTIQAWEQRSRAPTGAATTLLSLLVAEPAACQRALVALGVEPARRGRVDRAFGALVREWLEYHHEDHDEDANDEAHA
jgi:transcriptional regulator with XRE-family HTH domain